MSAPSPASADTVIDGCTIVSNPTATNFTNCPGVDLTGSDLSGVDLSYADLAGDGDWKGVGFMERLAHLSMKIGAHCR